jgi:uncharacterized membrane protein (TIGR02234 family)
MPQAAEQPVTEQPVTGQSVAGQPAADRGRREYALALLAGAAGAGLVLLAVHQVWAHASYASPHPLPPQVFTVTGQQLVPLASALGIAALACLAAVIATRGVGRRAAGLLLAVIGVGAGVAAAASVTAAAVLSAVAGTTPTVGPMTGIGPGSTVSGTSGGGSSTALTTAGHALITGWPWQAAAAAGAVVIVLAGLATAWRGPRWPVMSARFERPDRQRQHLQADSATMWESLSRDDDPTLGTESASDAGPAR